MESLSARASGDCSNPSDSSLSPESPLARFDARPKVDAHSLKRLIQNRFFRFLLVGGLNTLFGYSVFALCILIGLPYPIAALISTVLGVLFNFKSYGTLVFSNGDNRRIFRFVAVYGFCYVVGLIPLAWAKAHGVRILLMAALCALPMAALAFTLQRLFVFHRREASPGDSSSSG